MWVKKPMLILHGMSFPGSLHNLCVLHRAVRQPKAGLPGTNPRQRQEQPGDHPQLILQLHGIPEDQELPPARPPVLGRGRRPHGILPG